MMILTDNDVVYWIDGNTVHASNTTSALDLSSDFTYGQELGYPNYDLKMSAGSTQLAYDKYNNRVYLFSEFFCVFDITDMDNPSAILIGGTYNGSYSRVTNTGRCFCLNNGMIAVPGRASMGNVTFLFNPHAKAVQELFNNKCFFCIVDGKELSPHSGELIIYDLETDEWTTIAYKGEDAKGYYLHDRNYSAAPDGLCFWASDKKCLCLIDLEGRLHRVVEKGNIKSTDYSSLPYDEKEIYVNSKYSCAFYENSLKAIELMMPNGQ